MKSCFWKLFDYSAVRVHKSNCKIDLTLEKGGLSAVVLVELWGFL